MELDTIVCGNCLDVMADMPDGCVDAVVTDPPYEVGLNSDLCPWDQWPTEVWSEIYRVVKEAGHLVFSIAPHVAHARIPDVLRAGWEVLEVGAWIYGNGRPVHKTRLKRCWNQIYFLSKGTRSLFIDNARGAYRANTITGRVGEIVASKGKLGRQFQNCKSNRHYSCGQKDYHPADVACEIDCTAFGDTNYDLIFAVKRSFSIGKTETRHPTQKPLDLVAQQIKLVSNEGDLIFDPFIGYGTTAIAALGLDRHFYGCDITPEYIGMANKRIEKARLEMSQMEMDLTNLTNHDIIISNPRPTPGRHR